VVTRKAVRSRLRSRGNRRGEWMLPNGLMKRFQTDPAYPEFGGFIAMVVYYGMLMFIKVMRCEIKPE
jgi:hypothetical protein